MILTRTPFRVSFFGGGTDYPAWYRRHGGVVLAAALRRYCRITLIGPTPFGKRYRVVYAHTEDTDDLEQVHHPAVRACLRGIVVDGQTIPFDGMQVYHTSDLPARSGVGSSSTFVVGLVHALHARLGWYPDKIWLAAEATRIEQDVLQEHVGCQDQLIAAWGGFRVIRFPPVGAPNVGPPVFEPYGPAARHFQSYFLLFYSGVQRTASDVVATYADRFSQRTSPLVAIQAIAEEAIAGLRRGFDPVGFGRLLHEAWRVKRCLGTAVSTTGLDEIYETARRAGAYGGKVLGAGGGGFMLFLAPPEAQAGVRAALRGLIEVPFEIDWDGSRVVYEE